MTIKIFARPGCPFARTAALRCELFRWSHVVLDVEVPAVRAEIDARHLQYQSLPIIIANEKNVGDDGDFERAILNGTIQQIIGGR